MSRSETRRPTRSRRFDALLSPLETFLATEATSGLLLVLCAAVAVLWVHSPAAPAYEALKQLPIAIEIAGRRLEEPLVLWVNDLLMAIFFFFVGLEIKRELLVGELAGWKRASLPLAAALGGMLAPAAIYGVLNFGGPGSPGWGIPMATDIAFAVGVLALLGGRVPPPLKVFLLALAIIDDLGAILVIAVFYTDTLHSGFLALAAATWLLLAAYGNYGGARASVFLILGALLWFFTFESGVHATVAGVLAAFTVPIAHRIDAKNVANELRRQLAGGFERIEMTIGEAARALLEARSPLHRFEHALAPWVAYGIMPLFALLNAGVPLLGEGGGAGFSMVTLGVFLGLLIGKPLGILGACWLAERAGLARLPEGVDYGSLTGAGFLAGIGFTMSLFIAALAFPAGSQLDEAKIGVLAASVAAAVLGLLLLARRLAPAAGPAPRPKARGT